MFLRIKVASELLNPNDITGKKEKKSISRVNLIYLFNFIPASSARWVSQVEHTAQCIWPQIKGLSWEKIMLLSLLPDSTSSVRGGGKNPEGEPLLSQLVVLEENKIF